jgi:2-dehydropantoate 2-reductase
MWWLYQDVKRMRKYFLFFPYSLKGMREARAMAHVAIVGVGAIGGTLAGLLETTGRHEMTLCTRRPLPELTVKTPGGDVVVHAANAFLPDQLGGLASPVDWVLVATKTYDAAGAAAWIKAMPGAKVAVVQNGVVHRERFAEYVAQQSLLPVIIDCPAERGADGAILQRGPAKMQVEASPLGEEFAELFHGSTAILELTDDFVTVAWRKLCTNAAGAVSALMMQPVGILRDERLAGIALELAAECAAVGRAEGAKLSGTVPAEVLAMYLRQPPDSINSMLADRLAGKPTEIDARNGVIVRRGEQHGIQTPMNRMAVALLEALSKVQPQFT